MGKGGSAPPPPDYAGAARETAAAQTAQNTAQTWANRPNQVNPWGSTTWDAHTTTDPTTGQQVTAWTQNTDFDPRLRSQFDQQIDIQGQRIDMANDLTGRMRNEFGRPVDWSGMTGWGNVPQAGNVRPTTNAFGFSPSVPQVDMSRQATPQLQGSLNFGGAQDVQGSGASRQRAEDAIYQSA